MYFFFFYLSDMLTYLILFTLVNSPWRKKIHHIWPLPAIVNIKFIFKLFKHLFFWFWSQLTYKSNFWWLSLMPYVHVSIFFGIKIRSISLPFRILSQCLNCLSAKAASIYHLGLESTPIIWLLKVLALIS